jgi:hypothetical protein
MRARHAADGTRKGRGLEPAERARLSRASYGLIVSLAMLAVLETESWIRTDVVRALTSAEAVVRLSLSETTSPNMTTLVSDHIVQVSRSEPAARTDQPTLSSTTDELQGAA